MMCKGVQPHGPPLQIFSFFTVSAPFEMSSSSPKVSGSKFLIFFEVSSTASGGANKQCSGWNSRGKERRTWFGSSLDGWDGRDPGNKRLWVIWLFWWWRTATDGSHVAIVNLIQVFFVDGCGGSCRISSHMSKRHIISTCHRVINDIERIRWSEPSIQCNLFKIKHNHQQKKLKIN